MIDSGRRFKSNQDLDTWTAPRRGFVKINWDAAPDKQKKLMDVGVVVRNHTGGDSNTTHYKTVYINDPTMRKQCRFLTAAALRQQLGLMETILERNFLEVVQAARKGGEKLDQLRAYSGRSEGNAKWTSFVGNL